VKPALVRLWIVASLALVLGVVGASIASKERIRRDGAVVFLRLAPVDPRSLMQGDYMALRFALATDVERELLKVGPVGRRDGDGEGTLARRIGEGGFDFAPIRLDERGVATLAVGDPSALRFRYRLRGGRAWLGTNAFFFQEGQAERYAQARYGEFRLDRATGEAVLVALRDEELRAL
jgi:uncharacterized membrane-anchored protein